MPSTRKLVWKACVPLLFHITSGGSQCNAFLGSGIRNQMYCTQKRQRAIFSGMCLPLQHTNAIDKKVKRNEENLSLRKISFTISNSALQSLEDIVGVIFDMDGTLVKPCIDFEDMRKRIYAIADSDPIMLAGRPNNGDVLEIYEALSDDGKIQAKAVFDDIERKAIADMELMDGLGELCKFLDKRGIQKAILTRNVCKSVRVMQEKLCHEFPVKEFSPAVSRNTKGKDGNVLLPKPAPDGILHICDIWKCGPESVIMVGDSTADDIAAASRANCAARVLLQVDGECLDNCSGRGVPITDEEKKEQEPSLTISSLTQFMNKIK